MVSSRLYKWKVEREIGQKEKKGGRGGQCACKHHVQGNHKHPVNGPTQPKRNGSRV
ncbi:hypothetical protein ASPTUDRAFT_338673 [Aspergillus tubingensis CBS 134.48]|uniref:Uncharacterized protein n=1 Tax=Aspergillus tubingensis (strain CBS 134.48) TaxID=767770 RepID=A0A1L9NK79_ASPTC|nr:hypothetical protein ASPTUDRAFT_338673 [Aspergillus tubingensis CBS 134.48]